MKTLNILKVTKTGYNKVTIKVKKDYGIVDINRTVRKHTKEIRELQTKGIYCFEIQGILYWYRVQKGTNEMVQYKEPENFRSKDRTTNELKSAGRKAKVVDNSVKLKVPEVKEEKEIKKEEQKKGRLE